MTLRDRVAKAIYGRRYYLGEQDVDARFALYAKDPSGTDGIRMSIFSAYRDADAAMTVLAYEQSPPKSVSEDRK